MGLPACGGDEPAPPPGPAATAPEAGAPPASAPEEKQATGSQTGTAAEPTAPMPAPGPEDGPGGAGDEEAIRTEALVTGRGGRLRPGRIAVPPFIAVDVRLASGDGATYRAAVNGRSLTAAGGKPASVLLEGLQPDGRYTLRGEGASGAVEIVASAEPGGP